MIEVEAFIACSGDHEGIPCREIYGLIERRGQRLKASMPSTSGESGDETHVDDISAGAAFG